MILSLKFIRKLTQEKFEKKKIFLQLHKEQQLQAKIRTKKNTGKCKPNERTSVKSYDFFANNFFFSTPMGISGIVIL